MDIHTINENLSHGEIDHPQIFPHLDELKNAPYIFEVDFGLAELPDEQGMWYEWLVS